MESREHSDQTQNQELSSFSKLQRNIIGKLYISIYRQVKWEPGMVIYTCNPSPHNTEAGGLLYSEVSLVYLVRSQIQAKTNYVNLKEKLLSKM